jgi:putative alpha-1,2-mannosidase
MACEYQSELLIYAPSLINCSYVPGDQAALIQLYGGPDGFVKRLDYLHDQNITYIGNEVSTTSFCGVVQLG